MKTVDLHTLTGAYAAGALSEHEAAQFGRHLAHCGACTQEVRELRETTARLALAVAEVPPAALHTRVMAALPDVRQLPPRTEGRARWTGGAQGWRQRMPYLAAAACLVAAAVAAGVAVDARDQADAQHRSEARAVQRTEELSALFAAPDARIHTGALTDGGTATVVSSDGQGKAAVLYRGLPELPGAKVYELWFSRGGTMVPAGLLDPGSTTGSALLKGRPAGAEGVGITVEPPGGSTSPTGSPLVVFPL